jgi:hypothetical protein
MGQYESLSAAIMLLALLGLAMVAAAMFGTVLALRRRERVVPMLAVVAVIVVLEYGVALRMSHGYVWHYGPWTLWVIVGTAAGLEEVVRRGHRVGASIAVALAMAGSVFGTHLEPNDVRSHYREVAEWIDRDARGLHPTVATGEIGAIGYYSRADIVDYWGLLDTKAIDSVRHGDMTWWLSQKPDYWVTSPINPPDTPTVALAQFQREYKLAATFGKVTVYRRIAP